MKYFRTPLHRKEFVNKFGEKMTMVMTKNTTIWIHHEDCNKDFEKFDEDFDYIMDKDERDAISTFIDECEEIYLTKL